MHHLYMKKKIIDASSWTIFVLVPALEQHNNKLIRSDSRHSSLYLLHSNTTTQQLFCKKKKKRKWTEFLLTNLTIRIHPLNLLFSRHTLKVVHAIHALMTVGVRDTGWWSNLWQRSHHMPLTWILSVDVSGRDPEQTPMRISLS